ncbi:uncharacterized protein LOC132731429 [Ruditapes philippinarum]|uniref:uncharacterized protein LOC132731429 n=1 Tax=Ruditapes philippinarum TaxID=129788 RepID=UPI00295ABD95|nr:uncharacterized protein LOC132731429 [Ruditapes philippinarum]
MRYQSGVMKDSQLLIVIALEVITNNAPSHPMLKLSNVKLAFFSPNTTSRLQPLDQGVIQTLKLKYRQKQLQHILVKVDDSNKDLINLDVTLRTCDDSNKTDWERTQALDILKELRDDNIDDLCDDAFDDDDEDDVDYADDLKGGSRIFKIT